MKRIPTATEIEQSVVYVGSSLQLRTAKFVTVRLLAITRGLTSLDVPGLKIATKVRWDSGRFIVPLTLPYELNLGVLRCKSGDITESAELTDTTTAMLQ